MKTYLINLDRNPERLRHAQSELKNIGVAFTRFPAVDGASLSDSEVEAFSLLRPKVSWTRGQIGCFLSHFAIWEIAAKSPDEYTAVLEDDLHLSPVAQRFLRSAEWVPRGYDLIRLETSTNRVLFDKRPLGAFHGREIRKVVTTTWCMGAYVVSRQAAQRLIQTAPENHRPADYFLLSCESSSIRARLNIAQVFPALAIQDKFFENGIRSADFASNISNSSEGTSFAARWRYAFKVSPLTALWRTCRGYQRIPFVQ